MVGGYKGRRCSIHTAGPPGYLDARTNSPRGLSGWNPFYLFGHTFGWPRPVLMDLRIPRGSLIYYSYNYSLICPQSLISFGWITYCKLIVGLHKWSIVVDSTFWRRVSLECCMVFISPDEAKVGEMHQCLKTHCISIHPWCIKNTQWILLALC